MVRSSQEIRKALGAKAPVPVRTEAHGPFGVMQLQAELAEQLRPHARAGRPSDPAWTVRRLVGFRTETWEALAQIAAQASTPRRRVSPGQVAARLIEDGIKRLRTTAPAEADATPETTGTRRDA
jgi:hypothetical protein